MKKALFVATVGCFLNFERNDIKILQSLGYEVHIATNLIPSDNNFQAEGIIRHQIDFARVPWSKTNLNAYRQLKKLFSESHFDLVHCHTPMGGVLGRLVAKKYRKRDTKVMYTAHGFHFFKGAPLKNWILYYPIEWCCAFWTDELITINKEDYARAQRHIHAGHITYIPGVGVDVKRYADIYVNKKEKCAELGIPNDKFILLSVGELSDRKNHRVVIEALNKIRNKDIYYLIAGSGPLKGLYMELINKYGLNINVKLLGMRSDVAELCGIADCFVHPSVREGLGIAPLEAMASGLPLISAYINGIRDYTEDGITGCCVNPRSIDEMKNAILKMYTSTDFRNQCKTNNMEIVKRFDINVTQGIMRELYRKFINR